MRIVVRFAGCTRSRPDRIKLEDEFKNAMLDYCPSVEKLYYWRSVNHFEYSQAKWRGYWAAMANLSEGERKRVCPIISFEG